MFSQFFSKDSRQMNNNLNEDKQDLLSFNKTVGSVFWIVLLIRPNIQFAL